MEILENELARHDWGSIRCGCELSARHLPDMLRRVAQASTDLEAGIDEVFDHFVGPSILFGPAPAVIQVAFAALQEDISLPARRGLLHFIRYAAEPAGETYDPSLFGRDLNDECRTAAREGLWYLYNQLRVQTDAEAASLAYVILRSIEPDGRAPFLRALVGDRLLARFDFQPADAVAHTTAPR